MRCKGRVIGGILIAAGIAIILAILMPPSLWWIIVGAVLVTLGVFVLKK